MPKDDVQEEDDGDNNNSPSRALKIKFQDPAIRLIIFPLKFILIAWTEDFDRADDDDDDIGFYTAAHSTRELKYRLPVSRSRVIGHGDNRLKTVSGIRRLSKGSHSGDKYASLWILNAELKIPFPDIMKSETEERGLNWKMRNGGSVECVKEVNV